MYPGGSPPFMVATPSRFPLAVCHAQSAADQPGSTASFGKSSLFASLLHIMVVAKGPINTRTTRPMRVNSPTARSDESPLHRTVASVIRGHGAGLPAMSAVFASCDPIRKGEIRSDGRRKDPAADGRFTAGSMTPVVPGYIGPVPGLMLTHSPNGIRTL
jgi:hypothetical protein